MRRHVPPAFAAPFSAQEDTSIVIDIVFIEENWSTVIKYVKKRVIVEDVDGWTVWSVAHRLLTA
jgi:hypothetical protein